MTFVTPEMFGAVGDGVADDQAALAAMFACVGNGVDAVIDRRHAHSGGLSVTGKAQFRVSGYGVLKALPGTPVDSGHGGISFINCSSFMVDGITLDGNRAERVPAEAGCNLWNFRSCHDFEIIRARAVGACTDGYYMASYTPADAATYSHSFRFIDCGADDCFRQGMSIIQGHDGEIVRGWYENTNGTAPAAGIDLESNSGDADNAIRDITLTDVYFSNNDGAGLQISSSKNPTNIKVIRPRFKSSRAAGIIWGAVDGLIEDPYFDGADDSLTRGVIDVPAATVNGNVDIVRPVFRNMDFSTGHTGIYVHSGSAGKVRVRELSVDTAFSVAVLNAPDCGIENSTIEEATGASAILVNASGLRAKVSGNRISNFVNAGINVLAVNPTITDNILEFPTSNDANGCIRAQAAGARVERNSIRRAVPTAGYGIRMDASYTSLQDNLIDGFTGNPLYLAGGAATEVVGFKKRNVTNGVRAAEN